MSARRESNVEKEGFIDTMYSSGDSNMAHTSQDRKKYQEENNNEVDELSEELQMGCAVGAARRPPNICVETCVYDGSDNEQGTNDYSDDDDDAYSEEFEEESETTAESSRLEPKVVKSEATNPPAERAPSTLKLSKSHSIVSSKITKSVSGKSNIGSVSSLSTRRVNMSFSNERLREIERHNHILLTKIISARDKRLSSIPPPVAEPPLVTRHVPNAAVYRKKLQRRIDHENMILLRKIQAAKSSACSMRR